MSSPAEDRISLLDLCLKTVNSNLDLFCNAYYATRQSMEQDHSSFVLKKRLELLRRIYTSDLLEMLQEMNKRVTEYQLDFLIHRHVKEIDLWQFENISVETIKRYLSNAADWNAVIINFSNRWTETDINDVLVTMTNLKCIQLFRTPCTDHTLRIIGHSCPLLEELYLSESKHVTNNGLENLFSSSSFTLPLHFLAVPGTAIDEEGVAYALSMAPALKYLWYPKVPQVLLNTHEQELQANPLERPRKYELVELDFCESSDALRVCVAQCPNVEVVRICYDGNEEDLLLLAKFEKLRDVSLFGSSESLWLINSFLEAKGTALTSMILHHVSLCTAELVNFCPNLINLNLNSVIFSADSQQRRLSSLHSLTELSLNACLVEDEGRRLAAVALIEASPNLESLLLQDNILFHGDVIDVILQKARRLRYVSFYNSGVKLSFLISLIYCAPMLRDIRIDHCQNISEAEFTVLRDHLGQIKRKVKILR